MKGSLQIKGDTYYVVCYINGHQKWVNTHIEAKRGNKRKADEAMRKILDYMTEVPRLFEKVGFTDYLSRWLKDERGRVDIVTYEGYYQYVSMHIIPYFEPLGLPLQEVRTRDIEGYNNYKSKGGDWTARQEV